MRNLFSFILLLLLFQESFAQWSVGGKVGVNFTGLIDSPTAADYKWRTRFNIGGVAAYQLNDWLALQGELLYAQYGYRDDHGFGYDGIYTASIFETSHYIDVPLLLKVYPFRYRSGFNIEAGIQPGIFLLETMRDKKHKKIPLYMGDHNPINCSLVVGLAFELPDEKWQNWYCDLRYLLGVTEVYKDWGKINTQAVQLSVGYLFQL